MSSPQGEQLMVKLHAMGTKGRLGVHGTCGEMEGREWELQWSHAANMFGKCPGKLKVVKGGPIAV